MILLSDNDILLKLAQCDLVAEALTIFQCGLADCYVLDTAKYALFLNAPDKCITKRLGNKFAYERLCSLIYGCRELGAAAENFNLLEELMQVDAIDAGEQALLMHAHDLYHKGHPYAFTTGDKRALLGIQKSNAQSIKQVLDKRVDCLESIVLKAIHYYGFEAISQKICNAMAITDQQKFDTVLRMAFGAGRDSAHARQCLLGYLEPVLPFIRP